MKQLLKLTGCLALAGLFCLLPIGATGSQLPDHPHATRNCNSSRKSPSFSKSGVKILYPEGNEKMQRNANF